MSDGTDSNQTGTIDAEQWCPDSAELAWYEAQGLLEVAGDPADPTFYFRCVRSGSCCRAALCAHGERDEATKQCRYLMPALSLHDGSRLYRCDLPQPAGGDPVRQIGKGCCYPWASGRRALIQRFREGRNDLIAAVNSL